MIFPANSLVMKGLQPGGFTLPYTIISYNGRPERWITPFWQPAYPLHLYSHYILFTANRLCCCCCCYKYKYKYNISAFWGQFLHCVTSPLNAVRFGFLGIVSDTVRCRCRRLQRLEHYQFGELCRQNDHVSDHVDSRRHRNTNVKHAGRRLAGNHDKLRQTFVRRLAGNHDKLRQTFATPRIFVITCHTSNSRNFTARCYA